MPLAPTGWSAGMTWFLCTYLNKGSQISRIGFPRYILCCLHRCWRYFRCSRAALGCDPCRVVVAFRGGDAGNHMLLRRPYLTDEGIQTTTLGHSSEFLVHSPWIRIAPTLNHIETTVPFEVLQPPCTRVSLALRYCA